MRKVILAVALLCLPIIAAAVTSPMPYVKIQFLDNNGSPCAGCTLSSFSAGTSTPLATYTDSSGLSQNTNPIVLDSAGRANIWLGTNSYKFVLKDANGVTLWTVDNVTNSWIVSQSNTWTGTNTFTGTTIFTGTVTMSGSTTTICAPNTNQVVGQSSCYSTIAAAYAAGPSTGVTVVLGSDITISSAQTVTLNSGKPLWLNLNGRKITCTNTTGVCLTIQKPDATPRYPLEIYNGTIAYSGSSASITGLQIGLGSGIGATTNCSVHGVAFNSFNTANSVALAMSDAEDCSITANSFSGNTTSIAVNKDSNNAYIGYNWIQTGTNGIVVTDAQGAVLQANLIQSLTGTKAVQVIASTQTINNFEATGNWLENNGDTTVNSRQIYISAAAGKAVNRMVAKGNTYNGATNGVNGYIYEFAGAGTLGAVELVSNNNNIPLKQTGFPNGTRIWQSNESVVACAVCINVSGISNLADTGIHFATPGAGTNFTIYQGYPAIGDNLLGIRDDSTNADVLQYDHTNAKWISYKSFQFFNGNTVAGFSDAGVTNKWSINNATGAAQFNSLALSNCNSAAAPAVCGSAAAGSVVIAAASTNVVVNTTAVTANSQILLQQDASLGTRLGVTCNTNYFNPIITGRTAGTGFTIVADSAPAGNPLCLSYLIIN